MYISIEAFGVTKSKKRFRAYTARGRDLMPINLKIANDMTRVAENQFRTGGRYGGTAWPALAQSTVERKARAGQHPDILRRTDALYRSLTNPQDEHHFQFVDNHTVDFGSHLEYADLHNTGTSRMPARPIIEVTPRDVRRWAKGIQRYILTGKIRVDY